MFEVARLSKAMVFELNDKSILGVNSGVLVTGTVLRDGSIILNPFAWNQKQADFEPQEHDNLLERAVYQITKSLKKSTNILASALYSARSDLASSTLTSTRPTSPPLSNADISTLSISNLNIRMTNIELELGDVKSMLNRILAAISGGMQ